MNEKISVPVIVDEVDELYVRATYFTFEYEFDFEKMEYNFFLGYPYFNYISNFSGIIFGPVEFSNKLYFSSLEDFDELFKVYEEEMGLSINLTGILIPRNLLKDNENIERGDFLRVGLSLFNILRQNSMLDEKSKYNWNRVFDYMGQEEFINISNEEKIAFESWTNHVWETRGE